MDVKTIDLKKTILEDNDRDADALRSRLKQDGTYYLNIMSSPGSGKTTTLLGTIRRLEEADGDLLIGLSKSGETEESIRLVQELLRQGRDIDIWLLTYRRESTLSKLVSHCLAMDLAHEGDMWNVMPINSSAICLIVLQGLAVLVGERLGVTLDQFGRNHPGGAIGEYLRNVEVR